MADMGFGARQADSRVCTPIQETDQKKNEMIIANAEKISLKNIVTLLKEEEGN